MKTLETLKANSWIISLGLILVLFFKQCGLGSNQDKIKKDISKISSRLDSLPTQKDVQHTMNQVMFDFLIYEDDFDHKKTSLSEIKNKIDGQK